jgi:hypothetical protein
MDVFGISTQVAKNQRYRLKILFSGQKNCHGIRNVTKEFELSLKNWDGKLSFSGNAKFTPAGCPGS